MPVVGFEIETSWRTRKHIKGDVFNLLSLSPAYGVILFLRSGFKDESSFEGNFNAARRYVDDFKGVTKILVWSEKNVELLHETLFGGGA